MAAEAVEFRRRDLASRPFTAERLPLCQGQTLSVATLGNRNGTSRWKLQWGSQFKVRKLLQTIRQKKKKFSKAAWGVTRFTLRKKLGDYLSDCPALGRWHLRPHTLQSQNSFGKQHKYIQIHKTCFGKKWQQIILWLIRQFYSIF